MLGNKGTPKGRFGQKGVPPHSLIGGLHKSTGEHMGKKMREIVAQASQKYGSLEKK
jgi:hypothetical protein